MKHVRMKQRSLQTRFVISNHLKELKVNFEIVSNTKLTAFLKVNEAPEPVQLPISRELSESNFDLKMDIEQFLSIMDEVDLANQSLEVGSTPQLVLSPLPSSQPSLIPPTSYDSVKAQVPDETMDDEGRVAFIQKDT